MAITPARQRNAVSEGMALGVVLNGHTTIPFNKVAVDLAFEAAFRSWRYADRFPQVRTDLRNGSDGVWVMTRASNSKHVWSLFWETSRHELTNHCETARLGPPRRRRRRVRPAGDRRGGAARGLGLARPGLSRQPAQLITHTGSS